MKFFYKASVNHKYVINLKIMNSYRVLYNPDLFTHILSYLNKKELNELALPFKKFLHFRYILPSKHTLLYGQVQCGKTGKIIEYIQKYIPSMPKVIVIQNSICMLNQYIKAFKNNNILCKVISKATEKHIYKQENVILVIHNKFRINSLKKYMDNNKHAFNTYNLIMDESDQFINQLKEKPLFKNAKHVLHVTATPFKYVTSSALKKEIELDNTIILKPKQNYVGLNDLNIIEVPIINSSIITAMYQIINNDFVLKPQGIMLINCFTFVADMKQHAAEISAKYNHIPVAVISTHIYVYVKGVVRFVLKSDNIQKLFDMFRNISHPILIANRLSSRGINYTNSSYSRYISHQITLSNSSNYTGFIQKCRIFGVRSQTLGQEKPVIYCLTTKCDFVAKLKSKIENVTKRLLNILDEKPLKITIPVLKNMCRENNISKYSSLRKNEIIALLENNHIDVYNYVPKITN